MKSCRLCLCCLVLMSLGMSELSARFASAPDSLYYAAKRQLMTFTWDAPFGFSQVCSNHAPLGPFLGNGDAGVVAYTSENSQTLLLSKVDFVTDGWNDWAGNGAAAVALGGVTVRVDAPAAAGGRPFRFEMDEQKAELRLLTATVRPMRMTTWMTRNENLVVCRVENPSPEAQALSILTFTRDEDERFPTTARVSGNVAQTTRGTLQKNVRWISEAAISTRVLGAESRVGRQTDAQTETRCVVPAGESVYLLISVTGGGRDTELNLDEAAGHLERLTLTDIDRLHAEHEAWWREMWERSYVEINDDLLNRQYLTSIYLLASANNATCPTSGGMYGVWNNADHMMYHGDIHLNYNSQAGFYSVYSANRPELALPFLATMERLIPSGRQRAANDMGSVHASLKGKSCRGILFPVSALGIGEFYGGYWQQTINAPFNVPLFAWYYDYTGDKDFLRQHAYPYIRLVGDFYEDYLVKEPYGTGYRYCITTGGHENSWDLNPPSDLGFVAQTFRLLLRYSETLKVDRERRALWKDILTHLPEYKVIMPTATPNEGKPVYAKNEAGWDMPAHVIQLQPVYPCEEINLHSDSLQQQLARNTLYYYAVSQRGFTHTMNELGLSAFVMGARIGFPSEILLEKMRELSRGARKNGLIVDGHHCLEKTTVVETINSMMLQSVDGVLHLFPCWPDGRPASFTRLRAKGAFVVSGARNEKEVLPVTVESERGGVCRISLPWTGKAAAVYENGRRVRASVKNGICSFATKSGSAYRICPEEE